LDLTEFLGAIRCPTLVCTGALDPITPPTASEEIMEGLNAGVGRLSIIEGAGHFPWKDAPAEYARILRDFIARL
jgi:pimeloyl-ACP methyl ester carboxylesterase